MKTIGRTKRTRRELLRACLAMPVTLVLAACSEPTTGSATPEAVAQAQPTGVSPTLAPPSPTPVPPTATPLPTEPAPEQVLEPTPACGDDHDVTPSQTEGPFYTPDTPERTSLLEPGLAGTRLVVVGYVLSTGCQPVGGALLDFWHADDNGVYDNAGYRLRGHQFADDQGRYQLETIMPGLYTGRTRHIHVKVQAPNQPVLTTQLYFPGEAQNAIDGIFRTELLMEMKDAADGKAATFSFVLGVG